MSQLHSLVGLAHGLASTTARSAHRLSAATALALCALSVRSRAALSPRSAVRDVGTERPTVAPAPCAATSSLVQCTCCASLRNATSDEVVAVSSCRPGNALAARRIASRVPRAHSLPSSTNTRSIAHRETTAAHGHTAAQRQHGRLRLPRQLTKMFNTRRASPPPKNHSRHGSHLGGTGEHTRVAISSLTSH